MKNIHVRAQEHSRAPTHGQVRRHLRRRLSRGAVLFCLFLPLTLVCLLLALACLLFA